MSKTVSTSNALQKAKTDTTTEAERSQALATALYEIRKDHTFYAAMLQSMNISYSHVLPTAGVSFSTNNKCFELYINPMYFIKSLSQEQRRAVLLHEIFHLVNRHLTRVPFMKISNHNRYLMNIAADLSINQYIKGLPAGCDQCPPKEALQAGAACLNELCPGNAMDINDWFDTDDKGNKVQWPKLQTMEQYFLRLKDRYKDVDEEDDGKDDNPFGEGEGESDESQDQQGKSAKSQGQGKTKRLPKQFDEHNWEANAEESEILDALEDLTKRTMVKTSFEYSDLPGNIKELLDAIKTRKAELNYKSLLLTAIKKSASGSDRKHTWTRKSRRFGNISPGTKDGPQPTLSFHIDTSGSISIETVNEFLSVIDEFLRAGNRKCSIHLFSDVEYYSAPYKMGNRVSEAMIRNNIKIGGTCLESSLKNILKRPSDLNIFLTDGFFSDINVEKWLRPGGGFPQCLFVIEKQGTEDHPFAKRTWQTTVKIPNK